MAPYCPITYLQFMNNYVLILEITCPGSKMVSQEAVLRTDLDSIIRFYHSEGYQVKPYISYGYH